MWRIKYLLNILMVATLLLIVAINRDDRVLGVKSSELLDGSSTALPEVERFDDGSRVINSTALATNVTGYNGTTPLELHIVDGEIERVELLPNSETKSFLQSVISSGLLQKWDGMSAAEAASTKVEAVSGATMSSSSIIENVKRAAQYAASEQVTQRKIITIEIKDIIAIAVIIMGVALTFMRRKPRWLRMVLLAANVVVLGLWCGAFLSLSLFVGWLSNGFNLSVTIIPLLLLLVALLAPLFGARGNYCAYHCPLGSAQELFGVLPVSRLRIPPQVLKYLSHLRQGVLAVMLLIMWLGIGFSMLDYELFAAFMFSQASHVVIILAVLFILLSPFVPRPYCRFVCPTGAAISATQKNLN